MIFHFETASQPTGLQNGPGDGAEVGHHQPLHVVYPALQLQDVVKLPDLEHRLVEALPPPLLSAPLDPEAINDADQAIAMVFTGHRELLQLLRMLGWSVFTRVALGSIPKRGGQVVGQSGESGINSVEVFILGRGSGRRGVNPAGALYEAAGELRKRDDVRGESQC